MPLRRTRSRRPFRSSTNNNIFCVRRAQPDPPEEYKKRGGTARRFRPVFLSFDKEVVPVIIPERSQVKRTSESTRDPGIATPRQPPPRRKEATCRQTLSGRPPCGQVRRRVCRGVPGCLRGARDRVTGDRSVTPHAPQHNTKRAESLAGFRSLTVARSAGNQYCSFSLGKSPDFTSSM